MAQLPAMPNAELTNKQGIHHQIVLVCNKCNMQAWVHLGPLQYICNMHAGTHWQLPVHDLPPANKTCPISASLLLAREERTGTIGQWYPVM